MFALYKRHSRAPRHHTAPNSPTCVNKSVIKRRMHIIRVSLRIHLEYANFKNMLQTARSSAPCFSIPQLSSTATECGKCEIMVAVRFSISHSICIHAYIVEVC